MDSVIYTSVAAVVAFFIAVLSGLGVGSGGLFVIWITTVYGVGAPQARGMNLLFFVFSAAAAFIFHYKKRHLDLRLISFLAVFALIGTLLGVFVSEFIEPSLLRRIFGGFLVCSGAYSLLSKKLSKKKDKSGKKTSKSLDF